MIKNKKKQKIGSKIKIKRRLKAMLIKNRRKLVKKDNQNKKNNKEIKKTINLKRKKKVKTKIQKKNKNKKSRIRKILKIKNK